MHRQITQQFEYLNRCTADSDSDLQQLQQKQEQLIIHCQEIQNVQREYFTFEVTNHNRG